MPSLAEALASAAVLWLALGLALPKRSWGTMRIRLLAAAAGERRHAFGPPFEADVDVSPAGFRHILAAEVPRCLELGVPLWLATLRAEYVGWQRRRSARVRWASSPAGWIWAHLRGQIDEEELCRRLADAGHPKLADKARLRFAQRYAMPAGWLRDLEDDGLGPAPSPYPANGGGKHAMSAGAPLVVQTLGSLKISAGDVDLTADLLSAPTMSFLWQYLLMRTLLDPGRPVPRTVPADELYLGVEHERQLERLRRLISRMHTKSPAISRSLKVTERDLLLDIEACQIDVVEILRLVADTRGKGLLPEPVVAQIESAIAALAAEWLPDWDELQQSINGGRGAAEEYVRAVRVRLQGARVALLVRLGSHFLALKEAARAVSALDQAFMLDPDRDGLADELANALEAAGHRARAAEVRRRFVQRE